MTDSKGGLAGSQASGAHAGRRPISPSEARSGARLGWDQDAERYQREHGDFLAGPDGADLVWCPEGWLESEVALLGDPTALAHAHAVDLGCGAGQAARWLARQCASVIALDISHRQLALGLPWFDTNGLPCPCALIQADAHELPLPDASVDVLVSAFGVIAFVPDLLPIMSEIARVLSPTGTATLSVPHPFRWVFPDDPSADSLTVRHRYFDADPYVETDSRGVVQYAEFQHTLADITDAVAANGLHISRMWEPQWRGDPDFVWGGWSAATSHWVPKTLIVQLRRLSA